MRHVILAIAALLVFCFTLFAQWEILNEGVKGNLNVMDFVNEKVGWVAGDAGALLKTEDGGQSWQKLPLSENWNVYLLDFVNDSIGWTAASDWIANKNVIMKTTDGGQTWQILKEAPYFRSLYAIDEDLVYVLVCGDLYQAILKTSDGGENWEQISLNSKNRSYNEVCFVNRDTGFVTGSFIDGSGNSCALILMTEDGGATWTGKTTCTLGAISNLQFINDSTAFFIDGTCSLLYRTCDAFKTWPDSPLGDSTYVISYHALNRDTIYRVASEGGMGYLSVGYMLKKSADGGRTWDNKFFINWWVDKVYFSSAQVGFFFGGAPYGGTIIRSVDGGENWEAQLLTYPFHDVHFSDRNTGVVCGGLSEVHFENGNIFITSDGGKKWKSCVVSGGVIGSIPFVTDSLGFAAFSEGLRGKFILLETSDAGRSWYEKQFVVDWPDTSIDFCWSDNICFVSENEGWETTQFYAADSSGLVVLKTTNCGESWQPIWWKKNYVIHSLYFPSKDSGWAVGDFGVLIQYTAANGWQEKKALTQLPLNKVYFCDEQSGFIAGGYLIYDGEFKTIFFKTKNSGATWEIVPNLPYLIYDIHFYDLLHGWAVGTKKNQDQVILATNDGGEHWTVQVEGLIGALNALCLRDGYLWAVGDYGLVLRLEIPTAIENDYQAIPPSAYKLFQNFPNPFNPKTVIGYSVGAGRGLPVQVELSIYNILGQKVAALVSAKQPAGNYKVEWDATDFSSGVYFYNLTTDQGFIQTRKLVVLK